MHRGRRRPRALPARRRPARGHARAAAGRRGAGDARRGRLPRRPAARPPALRALTTARSQRLCSRRSRRSSARDAAARARHPARPRAASSPPRCAALQRPDRGWPEWPRSPPSPTTRRSRRGSRSRSGSAIRVAQHRRRARRRGAADRRARHGPVRHVEGRHPAAAAAVPASPRAVAQPLPAGGLQPDAARCSASRKGADRAEVAEGVRLRDRVQRCSSASSSCASSASTTRPASALLLLGAMTGGFAGGMVLKGKSGWCSTICPLLPVQRIYGQTPFAARRQQPLPAVRRLREELLRLQPAAPPTSPTSTTPTRYWTRLPQVLRRRLPGPDLAFFQVPDRPTLGREMLGRIALYMAVSAGLVPARWRRS